LWRTNARLSRDPVRAAVRLPDQQAHAEPDQDRRQLKLFERLSGERIYDELVLMFSEVEPLKGLRGCRNSTSSAFSTHLRFARSWSGCS